MPSRCGAKQGLDDRAKLVWIAECRKVEVTFKSQTSISIDLQTLVGGKVTPAAAKQN